MNFSNLGHGVGDGREGDVLEEKNQRVLERSKMPVEQTLTSKTN